MHASRPNDRCSLLLTSLLAVAAAVAAPRGHPAELRSAATQLQLAQAAAATGAADFTLADRVQRTLAADPTLRGLQIGVVQDANGAVILTGNVASAAAADRVRRLASGVSGVSRVENRLTIGGTTSATGGGVGTLSPAGTPGVVGPSSVGASGVTGSPTATGTPTMPGTVTTTPGVTGTLGTTSAGTPTGGVGTGTLQGFGTSGGTIGTPGTVGGAAGTVGGTTGGTVGGGTVGGGTASGGTVGGGTVGGGTAGGGAAGTGGAGGGR